MSVRLGKFSDLAKSLPASALDFDCLNLFSFSGTFAGDLKKQRKRNTLGSRTVTGQATGCGGVSPCLECWNMWGNGCNRICYSNTCTRCRRNLQERPQSWLAESRRFSAFGICDFPDLPLSSQAELHAMELAGPCELKEWRFASHSSTISAAMHPVVKLVSCPWAGDVSARSLSTQ